MIATALNLLALTAQIGVAVGARRAADARAARMIGIVGSSITLLATAIGAIVVMPDSANAWTAPLPVYVSLIAWIAITASPVFDMRPITTSRIGIVNTLTLATLLVDHPVLLALAWVSAAVPVFLELRDRSIAGQGRAGGHRVFGAYVLPSSVLIVVGAGLLALDDPGHALLVLVFGIGIREAVVPAHAWFPDLVERTPMALFVSFAAPQLGVFAHLRFLSDPLPTDLGQSIAVLGAITAVFAALMSAIQIRPRRALGYLMMSQTALAAFGLETHSQIARTGTLIAWMVSGIAMAGFAMALAATEARRADLRLDCPDGNFERVPRLATAFLLLGLASVGLPGTFGFIGEDLLIAGSVHEFPYLAFALIVATAINGISVVRAFFALFMGSRKHMGEHDLVRREWVVMSVALATLIGLGAWPGGAVRWLGDIGESSTSSEHSSDE